jgi:hypothetical protein
MSEEVYGASAIKRRQRATKSEMDRRAEAILDIVEEIRPCTVRQVFYQAVVRGLVPKTEKDYRRVQRMLVQVRRDGELDWDAIADNTRWMRKPASFSSVADAIASTAKTYRRDLWRDGSAYVEIWCEKDALAGVLIDITEKWDVPLMVSRGYASITYLYTSAMALAQRGKPAFVYHFGDHDPSGQDAARCIEKELREHAPDIEINFERFAVTPQQIADWNLPTKPTKQTDSRAKTWTHGGSVELDAIHPDRLRDLCDQAIAQHVDQERLRKLKVIEAEEKKGIEFWARVQQPEARP